MTSRRSAYSPATTTWRGVASDVFDRMVARGTLKADDFRIIYTSPIFPTSSFAYAHDLKPDLVKKIRDCFFAFHFPPAMQKEFNGDDRFFPITYKDTWSGGARDRRRLGTPYNKAAYEAETQARGRRCRQEAAAAAGAEAVIRLAGASMDARPPRRRAGSAAPSTARSSSATCARNIAPASRC